MPEEKKSAPQTPVVNTLETSLIKWLDEQRFLQAGITIIDLAIYCGTNRSYISEHINSTQGKNFRQWINELRINYAKRLLNQNPQIELWQITEQTGYTDSKYFSTLFKKLTGKTPSEYREKS
jgi:YesN/AraC family two-component response regulator